MLLFEHGLFLTVYNGLLPNMRFYAVIYTVVMLS